MTLPQLSDELYLTDSGLETDLIFHYGFDLPEFASFVLLDDARGREALVAYYQRHLDIAQEHGLGLILESATWRASSDWAEPTGYQRRDLARINREAVDLLLKLREQDTGAVRIVVSGSIGPRSDAYAPDVIMSADEAADYHREQVSTLAESGVDLVHAMTIGYADEAIGIIRVAVEAGVPVVVSFITETNGELLDGSSLEATIGAVEKATDGAAAYYGVNCAHPSHFAAQLPSGSRIRSVRANASEKSHAELDEATELDEGDLEALAVSVAALRSQHPALTILGGCCGTDARHIAAIAAACRG